MSKGKQSEFYHTQAWKKCRAAYLKSKGGLCERCLESGLIRPAEIVHHKIHISMDNITDERILLDWDNLQCVCRECHAALHPENNRITRRFTVDANGYVRSRELNNGTRG